MSGNYERIEKFDKLGFGMFVHFGLYSILERGEWVKLRHGIPDEKYIPLTKRFKVKKTWARELVSLAKRAGCKYITLTTRHHDGFSLYDTQGLNDYDAPHSAAGRDLVREFVDECNKAGIVPFFYHTLIDWYNTDSKENFPKYIDYLVKSVEILCKNYGKIGGLWFDGHWDNPSLDWQFDRLYGMIRKYQPDAMIINNTGMTNVGTIGHPEIDSVTFERGRPTVNLPTGRPVSSEMCQVFADTWGYAKYDINYKSLQTIIGDLLVCRAHNSNFLLNIGPTKNGSVRLMDRAMMLEIGKWIRYNKNFIYDVKYSPIPSENAIMLKGGGNTVYAVTFMQSRKSLLNEGKSTIVTVKIGAKIKKAVWLDNGQPITLTDSNTYDSDSFPYGTNMMYRVAKLEIEY